MKKPDVSTIKTAKVRYSLDKPVKDSDLIQKFCREGDTKAAAELLKGHERALYNYLWQMLRHTQDCEDVIQNTFAKALGALPRYREENHFRSWLFRIGHNEAVNVIRHRKRFVADSAPESHPEIEDTASAQPADPSLQLNQAERVRALNDAIANLPEVEREVVVLRLQEDIPFKEIARITGAPIGTVLARMHHAKKRLKTFLEPTLA